MTGSNDMLLPAGLVAAVAERARRAGVFGSVNVEGGRLVCEARGSAEPAFYSLYCERSSIWVSMQTPARYLSQSIEADLMFTGDKLSDLIHEEMVDLGYADAISGAPELVVEHFRSPAPEKHYTFRSHLPVAVEEWGSGRAIDVCAIALLGYEAAFRELGDMSGEEV